MNKKIEKKLGLKIIGNTHNEFQKNNYLFYHVILCQNIRLNELLRIIFKGKICQFHNQWTIEMDLFGLIIN